MHLSYNNSAIFLVKNYIHIEIQDLNKLCPSHCLIVSIKGDDVDVSCVCVYRYDYIPLPQCITYHFSLKSRACRSLCSIKNLHQA